MCEYCDMKNKPMAYRFDGIYKEKIYVQHLIPAKLRPNGQWTIKAEVNTRKARAIRDGKL